MSNIAEKLGLTNEVKEIKIGKSFKDGGNPCFHTIRYDFKPASMDAKKRANVAIGEGNQVTVTVPHIEGSGTTQTVFKGSKKPYQKECVLIIDNITGEIVLERLSSNLQVKKTRAEGSARSKAIPPMDNVSSKKSPPPQKKSPQKAQWLPSNHHSVVQKCSPLPCSPPNGNQQLSPNMQHNPSMPCIVPPTSNSNAKHSMFTPQEASINPVSENTEHVEEQQVGVLSSSESSDSNYSSSQESSDAEPEGDASEKPSWVKVPVNSNAGTNSVGRSSTRSQPASNLLPSMPKFSLLSEDLKLSESDSD